MGRFTRTNFYKKELVNGREEFDYLSSDITDFEIKRPTRFYTVQYDETQRPDLISIRNYGKQDYWWIILRVNDILDPWNDIEEGDVLRIPNERDIEDWFIGTK